MVLTLLHNIFESLGADVGKLIVSTFVFLGWGFYVMSGGADFVPEQRPVALAEVATVSQPVVVEVTRADTASLTTLNPAIVPVSLEIPAPEVPAALTEVIAAPSETIPKDVDVIETTVASAPAFDLRVVAGSNVNMRDGPGTGFGVLSSFPRGTSAEVLEVTAEGWAKIRIIDTGQIGWMAERLLTNG